MQILTLCFLLLLSTFSFSNSIIAQEPTEATPSSEVKEDIDKIRQAVKDKVQEKIDQIISKSDQKIGWVGQITQIDATSINILCLGELSKTMDFDEDTVFINSKRQNISVEDLKDDQVILAMGYLSAENRLLAKRVLITNNPLQSLKNTITVATVTDISQTTSIITLVTKDRQVYQVKSDKKSQKLEKNQKIIAILKQDAKDTKSFLIVDFKVISPLATPTVTE